MSDQEYATTCYRDFYGLLRQGTNSPRTPGNKRMEQTSHLNRGHIIIYFSIGDHVDVFSSYAQNNDSGVITMAHVAACYITDMM